MLNFYLDLDNYDFMRLEMLHYINLKNLTDDLMFSNNIESFRIYD